MKLHANILGSVALATLLSIGFSGCSDETTIVQGLDETEVSAILATDQIPFGDGSFTPYERVAVFPLEANATATYAKVAELANTLGKYVANTDEPTADSTTFKGSNWILAGLDSATATNTFVDENVSEHILAIPTKELVEGTSITKKVKVVEVCNSGYASKALGVTNVGDLVSGDGLGDKVANGSYHATALPCEISIYHDDKGIYVDMLNPETIFTLFFTEIFDSAEMENVFFKEEMLSLPPQVKSEIYALIYNAFDENNETYTKTDFKMGPVYSTMTAVKATTDTANGGNEPFRHYTYTAASASKEFTSTDAKAIAAKIISVMTSDAEGTVGVQESALLETLPSTVAGVTPAWRSGRLEPLKVPGGSWIVEACSPTYAKEALSTGEHHTSALPCEIAVTVNPDNNNTIDVSFLNPEFMFGALFADSMEDMTAEEVAAFNTIIDNINGDLKTIVDYAMDNNVTDIDGSTGTKITPIVY